jgi:hypothetical protein
LEQVSSQEEGFSKSDSKALWLFKESEPLDEKE